MNSEGYKVGEVFVFVFVFFLVNGHVSSSFWSIVKGITCVHKSSAHCSEDGEIKSSSLTE